jgi:hypothetical protein
MPARIASILLVASAAAQSFACVLIARIVAPTFLSLYRLESLDEARDFMPPITRFASEHSWLIAIALAAVCFGSLLTLRRFPERTMQCLAVGLCAEGLVTWSAMFCFCFSAFTGLMCLHHGPAPMIAALWPRVISKP